MCGACGVRPTVDWYTVGVPTDRVGRMGSTRRLGEVLRRLVAEHAGRVAPTLAGTALLVSSPTGASRIVTGAPSAADALRTLFAVSFDPALRAAADGEPIVQVTLPREADWEGVGLWFALLADANRHHLTAASAAVHTPRGPAAVEFDGTGIRASPLPGLSGPGNMQLTFNDASAAPSRAAVLGSLEAVTTRSAPGADRQR
jgi:hypothetical protein